MSSAFKRVDVYHGSRGDTIIAWDLHPIVKARGSFSFTVQVSRPGTDEWEDVATVSDTNHIVIDTEQRLWAKNPRLHYRVTADNTIVSPVRRIGTYLSERDSRLLSEMYRKEILQLENYTGTCGFLYKRRHWGVRCTACTDFNTGEVRNANCQECFGTGIVGGYFPPIPYFIALRKAKPRRISVDGQTGTNDTGIEAGRGIACIWLDSYDVWVRADSDFRYIIHSKKEVNFRGVPVAFDPIELRLAPVRDPVYGLTRPDMEI